MTTKIAKTTIMTILVTLMVAVIPIGNTEARAAAKKPGAVTKITKVKATQNTLKIKWNKTKNKTGYQVLVYAGSKKPVKSVKTKKTTYTVKGLKPATKYTLKVRAYKKTGKKTVYGKEKKITYKTAKVPAKTPAPAPINNMEDTVVKPGQSTSTGAALVAEYNAWLRYMAGRLTDPAFVKQYSPEGKLDIKWHACPPIGHIPVEFRFNAALMSDDKYEAFKTGYVSALSMAEIYVDIMEACGLEIYTYDAEKEIENWEKITGLTADTVTPVYTLYHRDGTEETRPITELDGLRHYKLENDTLAHRPLFLNEGQKNHPEWIAVGGWSVMAVE